MNFEIQGTPDYYTGTVLSTPKGSEITVLGYYIEQDKFKKYYVTCSFCSKDKELYPNGFTISKGHLTKGRLPCGCSKSPKWSKEQWVVKIKRECEVRDIRFMGFSGNFIGADTKLKLKDENNSLYWESTDIKNFFLGKGYPHNKLKSEKAVKEKLVELCLKEGHTFKQLSNYKNSSSSFEWICNKGHSCENQISRFLNCGSRCQDCARVKRGISRRVSLKDVKELLNTIFEQEENLLFVGFCDEYTGKSNAIFEWRCSHGHDCKSSVCKFLSGRRCKTCAELGQGLFGYYPSKINDKDYLYVYKIKGLPFIKVGRTFRPEARLKENQNRVNRFYGNKYHKIEQVALFYGNHGEIYEHEQKILHKFENTPKEDCYGSSECIKLEELEKVLHYCSLNLKNAIEG